MLARHGRLYFVLIWNCIFNMCQKKKKEKEKVFNELESRLQDVLSTSEKLQQLQNVLLYMKTNDFKSESSHAFGVSMDLRITLPYQAFPPCTSGLCCLKTS